MKVTHISHPYVNLDQENQPHVMALGFFDGVHLGHQALLREAGRIAKRNQFGFSVMTFSPHPDEVIKGDMDRKYLTLLDEKLSKLESLGVDQVFVMTFDRGFASLPPIDFIQQYIIELNVKHVVVGFDFTFGFKAQGNTELLGKLADDGAYGLTVVPKKTYNNEKISSTLVRNTLADGEVDLIPCYLGAHYEVIVHSDQQVDAKKIKVFAPDKRLLPKPGVYDVKVTDGKDSYNAVFERVEEKGEACEIRFMTCRDRLRSKEFSVKFLNRMPVNEALSV